MTEKKPRITFWHILGIIFFYIALGIILYVLGASLTTSILFYFLITLIFVITIVSYIIITKRREKEKAEIAKTMTPEASKEINLNYLLKEHGLVPHKIIHDTPKVVGSDEQNPQIWHWLRFIHKHDRSTVDIFRNLLQVDLRAVHFNLTKHEAERELLSLGAPMKEQSTFIKKFYNEYGTLVRIEEGTTPQQVIEKTIEVTKDQGTVEGSEAKEGEE